MFLFTLLLPSLPMPLTFFGRLVTLPGMSYRIQYHLVVPGPGTWCMMTAKLRASAGAPVHSSGSVEALPSPVKSSGSVPPSITSGLRSTNSAVELVAGRWATTTDVASASTAIPAPANFQRFMEFLLLCRGRFEMSGARPVSRGSSRMGPDGAKCLRPPVSSGIGCRFGAKSEHQSARSGHSLTMPSCRECGITGCPMACREMRL